MERKGIFVEGINSCIILAAGAGRRMGGPMPKQFILLEGKPILTYTIETFENCPAISEIILITSEENVAYCREMIIKPYGFSKIKAVEPGGCERQNSVEIGLKFIHEKADIVIIQDGVRPFVKKNEIEIVIQNAKEYGACCLGVPVKDTIKICSEGQMVLETPDRKNLWAVQTPQAFKRDVILEAYRQAAQGPVATDDAGLVERAGYPVRMVEGSYANIKITTEEDIALAAAFLKQKNM